MSGAVIFATFPRGDDPEEAVWTELCQGQEPRAPENARVIVSMLRGWLTRVGPAGPSAASDGDSLDLIGELERLKASAAAAQARLTAAIADSREAEATSREERAKITRSVGSQVALARRESPWRADRLVGLSKALTREMPHTLAALEAGDVSEWGATVMVRDTATPRR